MVDTLVGLGRLRALAAPGPETSVFAVEDTMAQLVWGALPAGPVRIAAGDVEVEVDHPGGAGAAVVEGLAPDTEIDVRLGTGGERPASLGRVRTLAPPPGEEVLRLATVNDIHLGDPHFGRFPTVNHPPDATVAPPELCLAAALDEMVAWGAQLIVVKGDVTDHGRAQEWETMAALLAATGVPALVIPGNHDVIRNSIDPTAILAGAGVAFHAGEPTAHDWDGIRLVLADTTRPGHNTGTIAAHREAVARLVAEAPGPALVAMHHHPQRSSVMTHPPRGIPGREAIPFLDALAAANPATMVITGHSHRHRAHRWGPMVVTEVGSPQDYPGTWAGYAVNTGGIRQVVRRVSGPEAIAWTESTKGTFAGMWGRWSPGTLDQRCFTHRWPTRT